VCICAYDIAQAEEAKIKKKKAKRSEKSQSAKKRQRTNKKSRANILLTFTYKEYVFHRGKGAKQKGGQENK
jgi:hypothetical protein